MSNREKGRRAVGLWLAVLFLVLCATPQFRSFVMIPDHVRLPQGQAHSLQLGFPFRATVHGDHSGSLLVGGGQAGLSGRDAFLPTPLSIAAVQTGQYTVDLRLFGLLPLRRLSVDVVPPMKIIPGGHSIGVMLRSQGVLVVGHASVRDHDGTLRQPARDGGIELGDAILRIGDKEVTGEEQVARLVDAAGKNGGPVAVTVRRKGKVIQRQVKPVRDRESRQWRMGLYIRDGATGVGTLTFYDPASGKYGALGHIIADGETAQPIIVRDGHIVDAVVTAIEKGRRGAPGEKMASFVNEKQWLGTIEKNSRFGIFGTLQVPVKNPFYREPVPVAMASQVREGPAEILTVVEGQKMERFTIEIQRVMAKPTADGKNMIVKITDPRLLAKTGGIVQGMSGSPILQEGRIVGAVTHVFVNDPTRGYAALIEWMLQEAGVLQPARSTSFREVHSRIFSARNSGNALVTAALVW